jgi:hypothetical protein
MHLFRGELEFVSDAKANKYKNKSTLSRIYFTVRNLVGLTTDSLPTIEFIPENDGPKSINRAKALQANTEWQMLENDFSGILAMALFDTWIKRDSYLMWFWNHEKDDLGVEAVQIEDLMISSDASNIQDAEFVIYKPWKNRKWWKDNYPDHYDKIKFTKKVANGIDTTSIQSERGNSARFIQYWENSILIEKVKGIDGKDIILKKTKNPYYEFRTPEEQQAQFVEQLQKQQQKEQNILQKTVGAVKGALGMNTVDMEGVDFVPIKNYLISPRKPFVQIPSVKLLGELYSENITKHAREVFLSMNEKKRAFSDNLRGCNQKFVVDSGSMTKKEASKITDEPNQVIMIDFADNPKPFYIEKGGEVPASFHNDIMHDERYIDDVYGHHEISRGAGQAGTLGQDKMNAQSDRTPVRFQSRGIERAIVEMVEGWLQLTAMFYTKAHYAKKWGEKEGMKIIEVINEHISEGVKPHIKPGSMITLSKEERSARATALYGAGALDPYTLFVELDMPNPSELADRLVNWLKFQMISNDDPEQIQADITGGTDPIMQSVERADMENRAIQNGDNVPPTPPEFVTEDHVKSHYAALNDKEFKLEDEDADILRAHAEVDKATLAKVMTTMLQSRQQGTEGQQNTAKQGAPAQK